MYTFKVELDRPSRIALAHAQNLIRHSVNHDVDASRMAPTCGISMGLPTVLGQASPAGGGIEVSYGFTESPAGSCLQAGTPDHFAIELQVPMNFEPAVAESFVKGIGIPLPGVKIYHPYKYADKVSVHIDTMKLFEQLKDMKSFSGSVPVVQASINNYMSKALSTLQAVGVVKLDIQNPDPKVQERMFEIVTDMMKNIFFKFVAFDATIGHGSDPATPEACKAQAAESLIKTAGGQSIPMCVSATLSQSETSAREIGNFDFDLSQQNYGTLYSDASIEFPELPGSLFDKKVRDLDPAGFGL